MPGRPAAGGSTAGLAPAGPAAGGVVKPTSTSPATRRPSLVVTVARPRPTAMRFCDQYSIVSRAVISWVGVVIVMAVPVISRTAWSMS